MNSVLIAGIGNVLLGDDAVGPYILKQLESQYEFGDGVLLADLGTPALDLTHQIVGLRALILIDCVAGDQPGRVILYNKDDILRAAPAERLDPHSPALSECLMTADMLGASPQQVLLVGIVGQSFDPGRALSPPVEQATGQAIQAVLGELDRLGYPCWRKSAPPQPDIWWSEAQESGLHLHEAESE